MEQQELHYIPEWYAVRWSNKNSTINQNGMLLDGATRTPVAPSNSIPFWFIVEFLLLHLTAYHSGF
jgi:hypothetical protein